MSTLKQKETTSELPRIQYVDSITNYDDIRTSKVRIACVLKSSSSSSGGGGAKRPVRPKGAIKWMMTRCLTPQRNFGNYHQDCNRLAGIWKTHVLEINGGENVYSLQERLEHAKDLVNVDYKLLPADEDIQQQQQQQQPPPPPTNKTRWILQCHRGKFALDDGQRRPGEKTVGSLVREPARCLSVYLCCLSMMDGYVPNASGWNLGPSTSAGSAASTSYVRRDLGGSKPQSKRAKRDFESRSGWSSDEDEDEEDQEEELWARFRISLVDRTGRKRISKSRNYVPFSRSQPRFGFSGFIHLFIHSFISSFISSFTHSFISSFFH